MAVIVDPNEIEARSFKIIDGLLKDVHLPKPKKDIVKRVIHTTADCHYARDLLFSLRAIEAGISAIRQGANIVVDSSMVKAGINKEITTRFNNKIICRINDKDVRRKALRLNLTRAIIAARKSREEMKGAIVAVGNAPTALFEICELVESAVTRPALIVGVPVGFVGAVESKRRLRASKIPYITNKTRKGGSTVAAAIVNALLILAKDHTK